MSSTCFELEGSSSGRRLYIHAWCIMSVASYSIQKYCAMCIYNRLPEVELLCSKHVR